MHQGCLNTTNKAQVTANYTARTACGDLLIKMGEWLHGRALEGLFAHTKTQFPGDNNWRTQEACLYLFNMLISDFFDRSEVVPPEIAQAHVELITYAIGMCWMK